MVQGRATDRETSIPLFPSVGCCTGCSEAIKKLSTPELLNDQWAVVKVQTTLTIMGIEGNPEFLQPPLEEWAHYPRGEGSSDWRA